MKKIENLSFSSKAYNIKKGTLVHVGTVALVGTMIFSMSGVVNAKEVKENKVVLEKAVSSQSDSADILKYAPLMALGAFAGTTGMAIKLDKNSEGKSLRKRKMA